MKYWLSHLPLEVWVDVFCYPWTSREELGRMVDRIGNRKFAEYLQFYLHDWGKRKLKQLWIDRNGPNVPNQHHLLNIDFPQTPMPGNIKSFERISISHFNTQIHGFLRQLTPILTNVNLGLFHNSPTHMESFRIVLAHLLPLLNGINSLEFNVPALPIMQKCFGGAELAKLKKLEILDACQAVDEQAQQAAINFLMNWLISSPAQVSIGPKLCEVSMYNHNQFLNRIYAAIREDFLAAKSPATFSISWHPQFAEFHLVNSIGEELNGVKTGHFQISRHRTNCGKELEEWVKQYTTNDNNCRSIAIGWVSTNAMKYWLNHLSQEVWVVVFRYSWTNRRKLGQIVVRFGNRKFVEYLQFYLHDCQEHTLNELYFDKYGLYTFADCRSLPLYLDIPQTPMPEKITSFEYIQINHLDAKTLAFLGQIRPLLTEDVELKLVGISQSNLDNLRVILSNLVPMLDGIHSMTCAGFPLQTVKQCLGEKWAKLSVLKFKPNEERSGLFGGYERMGQEGLNFVMNWLTAAAQEKENNNNGPKLFEAAKCTNGDGRPFYWQIIMAVLEQFRTAKTPSKFAVVFHEYTGFRNFHVENNIGEELHCARYGYGGHHRITRLPTNCGTELREWVEKNVNNLSLKIGETSSYGKKRGQIDICFPTIGNELMSSVKENAQQHQQPSASKTV